MQILANVVSHGRTAEASGSDVLAGILRRRSACDGITWLYMYAKRTVFDLVLPENYAGEILTKEDLDLLGEGGLWVNCLTRQLSRIQTANVAADRYSGSWNCGIINVQQKLRNESRENYLK